MEKNCHPFFGEKIQTLPSDTFPTKLHTEPEEGKQGYRSGN